ncbi:MAG: protein-L-isoaspartate(D-aspartate) O-methyltransferase [Actinomycetia bacterium]|nr:protein-L-isoaspartate(D-aspartate) O-methyltransferase [Actinomycetes bacterium]
MKLLKKALTINIIFFILFSLLFNITLIFNGCAYIKKVTVKEEEQDNSEKRIAEKREYMVTHHLKGRDIVDEKVLEAMGKAHRHKFVLERYLERAYEDHPLPIGYGQTISQPYIVALMTQLLELKGDEKVLEIGTGSGYQAAILAEIVEEVYTVEIIDGLCESARNRLDKSGYDNVKVLCSDGYFGWEENSPFDKIIVTCAPDHIPPPLIEQLKEGGVMVLPVGPPGAYQVLWQIKNVNGELEFKEIIGVSFVPLTGKH